MTRALCKYRTKNLLNIHIKDTVPGRENSEGHKERVSAHECTHTHTTEQWAAWQPRPWVCSRRTSVRGLALKPNSQQIPASSPHQPPWTCPWPGCFLTPVDLWPHPSSRTWLKVYMINQWSSGLGDHEKPNPNKSKTKDTRPGATQGKCTRLGSQKNRTHGNVTCPVQSDLLTF